MKQGPQIAPVAALIGDPARANILAALMDGRALAAGELAETAGVTRQTASEHLSKLLAGGLLAVERQGRHRYYRLSGSDIADLIESLFSAAQRTGAVRVRTGPREPLLRQARICYDHLAGAAGVRMAHSLTSRDFVSLGLDGVTEKGRAFLNGLGMDVTALGKARRPLCRPCLDWSERRHHLGGALGAAILHMMRQKKWLVRGEGRILEFTSIGERQFSDVFPAGPLGNSAA
ncbi:winged helix-turn-helix transcriptional regulator [Allosphingosinicella flava]|uniref:Winged helix-turn-helix transcriptional regulator n=2 Tax=Allosphingosinicella flava TaxID=2771430 RepID=A0A7T2GM26_9SPHN|nr:winged helix-turn-helix transcriptional regulator [Sphingosinicella flava]